MSKVGKIFCIFLALTMVSTMVYIPGVATDFAVYADEIVQGDGDGLVNDPTQDGDGFPEDEPLPDDGGTLPDGEPDDDDILPDDGTGGGTGGGGGEDPGEGGEPGGSDEPGGETPPEEETVKTVSTAAELEQAIGNGEQAIKIVADFTVDRTFYISKSTYIYTEAAHTLTRDPAFGGDIFVVGEDAEGTASAERVVLSLGHADSTASDLFIIDGNSTNMTTDVVGTVVFVCGMGQADLYPNLTVKNCKKVGNVRAADAKHGMSNTAYIGGAVAIAAADSILNIYGGKYTDNSVNTTGESVYGGAFYNFSTITVYGGLFENNSAVRAGAFYNYRKLYIYNAIIRNNTATKIGGAIYNPASTGSFLYLGGENDVTESDVLFIGNTAETGGAISNSGKIFAKDTVFEENEATDDYGGAIYSTGNYNVIELENVEFTNNKAAYGGAISSKTKTTQSYDWGLKAKNVSFTGNTAGKSGGAVYMMTEVEGLFQNCDFEENASSGTESTDGGGAIFCAGAVLEIDKATFTDNQAYYGAAIILKENSVATINGVVATENVAAKNGGVINATSATLHVYNGTMDNNTASAGSAIYMGADATGGIYKTSFDGNTCDETNTNYAPAVYLYTGGTEVTVHSCKFTNNTSAGQGGAMAIANKTQAKLYNITAIGNTAGKGGVLYITAAGTVVEICGLTVSGNKATTGGAIIWGNTANAKLNIDKAEYRDLDNVGALDDAYWSTAVANKLTVTDKDFSIPGYVDYSKEDMSTLWNSVDVKSLSELEAAIADGQKPIRIAADITISKTLYITKETTIFTTDDYKLLRDAGFAGDMFVVGEKADGSLCESTVKLILGNAGSETSNLLFIDGNAALDGNTVSGAAVYVTDKGQLDVYDNVTFVNNKNNGQNIRNSALEAFGKAEGAAITVSTEGIANIHGGTFNGNGGSLYGGAIYNFGTLNIYDGLFEGNVAELGGAIYNEATMNVQGGTFSKNSATCGGAIYNSGVLTVKGATFRENVATDGGAIYGEKGTIDINGNTFTANVVSGNGGAVYILDGTVTSYDVTFAENKANIGGAIYVSDAEDINCTLTSSTFTNNVATIAGALYLAANGADISTSAFEGNTAQAEGGAIVLAENKNIMLLSVTAGKNKAGGDGGFLYAENASFTLQDSTVSGGSAENGGALALAGIKSGKITGTNFDRNSASGDGGAVYSYGGNKDVLILGGTFSGNVATDGGAISANESALEISGTKFIGNIADLDGGAVAVKNSENVVMLGIEGDGNIADNDGGFLYAISAEFKLYDSTVKNSEAGFDGGALMLNDGTKSGIYGTDFINNTAGRHGGVVTLATDSAENIMHTCTFEGNTAENNGGVAYVTSMSIYKLYNAEIKGNTAGTGSVMYIRDAGTLVMANGLSVSNQALPLIWGANASSVLHINKNTFTDADGKTIDAAYWEKAIKNKLTVKETNEGVPLYQEFGNEFAGSLTGAVSVSSAKDLEDAVKAGEKNIRIIADFELDRTFYITSDVTIFSTAPRTLTRKTDFGGDIFVVGEDETGKNSMIEDADAKLTLGNPSSETLNLLTIDGNKDNMTVPVTGTVLFVCYGAQVNLHKNITIQNCHKNGNERTAREEYVFSRPNRIGGAVGIIASGLLNVYGGTYRQNSVLKEDTSTEEGRNSTIGGVFYNESNLRIYDGLFEANTASRGGIVYNYLGMKILGGQFINNHATTTGGVYYSPNSASVHLLIGSDDADGKQIVFRGNVSESSAGVIYSSTLNGLVVYGNTVFEENKAVKGSGGAICVYGMLTAKNAVFRNNNAGVYGGAIYMSNSTESYVTRFVNLTDCIFEGNTAENGGVLGMNAADADYENGAIATISNSSFISNQSEAAGGVLYMARKSRLSVDASEFMGNTSGGEAGAMYIVGDSQVDIQDSTFDSNTAGNHGGALSVRSSALMLKDSALENNISESNGGAIYVSYLSAYDVNSDIKISGSTISDNTSDGSGGAIYATRRDLENYTHILTVVDTDFDGNTAKSNGGAILTTAKAGSYFKDVTFTNNSVTSKSGTGGAIALFGTPTEIDGAILSKNTAGELGGGIYMKSGANAILHDINASRNNAANKGGFLYNEESSLKLYDSTVRGNTANFGGGMYLYTNAASETYNTDFKDNVARTDNGGALFVYTGPVQTIVSGASFTGNTAGNSGGAMYVSGESDMKLYNTVAKNNSADSGGFMYETKAGTVVLISKLTVSGNTDVKGGPIIWGNTKNAVLNIDKSSYTDLDVSGELDDAYWAGAIANLLTVNDVSETVPEEDVYEGEEEPEEVEQAQEAPVSVQDVFRLGQTSSDAVINDAYGALPRLDNSSNFMSRGVTTFDNINGETVTVDTFVYPYRGTAHNMNVGQGLLIYQALLYKQAFPQEEVYIDVASYRFSVDAAVNINRNSRYFGYMRNLGNEDYDEYGFVKIAYLLVTAAKMGIHVTAVGHVEGYPVKSRYNLDTYFSSRYDQPCDPAYVPDGKIGDYLNFAHSMWTLSAGGKGGTDMMHTKMCAVSHYLDMNGVPHKNAVFSSSSNLDGIRSDIQNGNWNLQTGSIVSNHEQLYRVASNYLRLLPKYAYQEGIIEIQDYVNTKSTEQIDMILEGRGNEIPENERIVYIGTEADDVFELYFTPFGGARLAWDEVHNPYCKYVRELHESEDYIYFTWNAAEYASYDFGRQIEAVISDAFHTNRNVKNKIYVNGENFDVSAYDDLKEGVDIGFKSFNKRDFGGIHNKDVQVSYVKDGQRYNVTLLNSLNNHGGSMYFQSNFLLVIKETSCAEDSVFVTLGKYTTKGDMTSHTYSEEVFTDEGTETEHGYTYHECTTCGNRKVLELRHRGGEWIVDREPTETENGVCHRNCVLCGKLAETKEIGELSEKEYRADTTTGTKFTASEDSLLPVNIRNTPHTFEATMLLPKTVKGRGGVIIGNNGKADGKPINFEIYEAGKPKLFYMVDGERADVLFNTDIRSNDPVHVAITADDKRATLYVNGEVAESKVLPFAMPETTQNFVVGGDHRAGNGQYFKGTIYSVSVFSDVRTEEEILQDVRYVPRSAQGLEYAGYYKAEEPLVKIGGDTLTGICFTAETAYTTEMPLENVPGTIEAIIHIPTDFADRAGVICGNYHEDKANVINLEAYADGVLRLYYKNESTSKDIRFTSDIRSDEPIHLAITFEEEAANLYINGELAETKALTMPLPALHDTITVGGDQRRAVIPYFQGTLYALNMFEDVRTPEEIQSDMFGVTEEDASLLLSVVATPNGIMERTKGQTFDEFTMGHVPCVLSSVPATFEAVVQLPESCTGRGGIILGNNGGDDDIINFEIYKNGQPRFYYITDGVTTDCIFDTDVRSDKLVHLAVTMDGFTATLYVNGEAVETKELDYLLGDANANYVIGGDYRLGNSQYFKGTIYSVNLFETVRTEEEIKKDAQFVSADVEGLLYGVNYIREEAWELLPEEIHPDTCIIEETPATEEADGIVCTGCAMCGALLSVKVLPAENDGFNHMNIGSAKGLAQEDSYKIEGDLFAAPKTVEILLQLSPLQAQRGGTIFGNYDASGRDQINFEVYTNGHPRLWFKKSGVTGTFMFNTDIRSEEKTHVAFTIDGNIASLYVNGEFKESIEMTVEYPEIVSKFVIGSDNRKDNSQTFKGTIYALNVFDDARTAEEIRIDAYAVASNTSGLVYSKYFLD